MNNIIKNNTIKKNLYRFFVINKDSYICINVLLQNVI